MDAYILDEYLEPHKIETLSLEYLEFHSEFANRQMGMTTCVKRYCRKETTIATVFLTFNHNYSMEGPPVLFETMVFSDHLEDDYTTRYETYEDAIEGHKKIVELVMGTLRAKLISEDIKVPAERPGPNIELDMKDRKVLPKRIKHG